MIRRIGGGLGGLCRWGRRGIRAVAHYADQAEAWANVEYIPQLWDWEEIRREAVASG